MPPECYTPLLDMSPLGRSVVILSSDAKIVFTVCLVTVPNLRLHLPDFALFWRHAFTCMHAHVLQCSLLSGLLDVVVAVHCFCRVDVCSKGPFIKQNIIGL